MKRTMLVTCLTLTLLCSIAASADTIATFNLSGVFEDNSALTGTLQVDTTVGTVVALNAVVGPPTSLDFPFLDSGYSQGSQYIAISAQNSTTALYPAIVLTFPLSSWVNYDGGIICGYQNGQPCGFVISGIWVDSNVQDIVHLKYGQATPVPEPSSLAFIAGGLGLTATSLRRRVQAL